MASLLAVDLGLRTGLAVFGDDGRLRSYRSQNYGTVGRLKRGAFSEIAAIEDLAMLVAEGDVQLARAWTRVAEKRGAKTRVIQAHDWRPTILRPRDQTSGSDAKRAADVVAREVIARSGAPKPTSLRHDAAEAILIGWWGCQQLGWA
ncbi:MAG: hypothetical protein AAGE52_16380 [Myxococcota bacterium]